MKLLQITPNLMVSDVAKSTTFYTNLFDLEIQYLIVKGGQDSESFDTEVKPGVVYQYVGMINNNFQLSLQESESILDDVKEITAKKAGMMSGNLYFEVEDLEEVKAKLADVEFREEPTTWYGMKEVYFTDPDGYVVCVAQKDASFSM